MTADHPLDNRHLANGAGRIVVGVDDATPACWCG